MLICSFGVGVIAVAQDTQTKNDTEPEAERLWEQAITAKGGRERLYAVENMVVSSRLQGRKNLIQKVEFPTEEFYVFPNKLWRWSDGRGTVFRLAIEMFNIERNIGYLLYPDDPVPLRKTEIAPREREFIFYAQLLYLMETKWQKPRLLATHTERIGFKKYDVVETVVEGEQIDFYLDRKTHLPVRIVDHYVTNMTENEYNIVFNLDDYVPANGIQMPQRVTRIGLASEVEHVSQQTNVTYDKSIFEHPPSIEAGAEA